MAQGIYIVGAHSRARTLGVYLTKIYPDIMLMYGKEASNRKQEINRQHHTIPNQRPKDKHYGNVHSQLYTFPRMPTMALL